MIPLFLQISPFILNTVMTITAAMTARRRVDDDGAASLEVGDLWSVRNIYGCNFWFLGVDSASEATESLRDLDQGRQGESFSAEVKVNKELFPVDKESSSALILKVNKELFPVDKEPSSALILKVNKELFPVDKEPSSALILKRLGQEWSSLLQLRADMTLEVNYFNEIHAVWEPLIERVDGGRRSF
ncbi:hypothetical protein F7725_025728 [Dissostichus mawsoni]|uniref:Uncharacterized protein n=1 Tax=Dissostichus mawsoni TaxID=36200 RepID=A0A7J5X5G6_DISMA|nr:hypothetical protein F7725_025728 [Dissostichus mawsoni]